MKIPFTIRTAKHSDIEKLIELLKVLFSIENRSILVAEFQNQVIGMISGQTLISTAEGGISVLVEDVVIDKVFRGQGIGKELLIAMETWAIEKGAKRLQLLADINNSAALTFYKKLRWKNTSLICLQKKTIS